MYAMAIAREEKRTSPLSDKEAILKLTGVAFGIFGLIALISAIYVTLKAQNSVDFTYLSITVPSLFSAGINSLYSASYYWFQPTRAPHQIFEQNVALLSGREKSKIEVTQEDKCSEKNRNIFNVICILLAIGALTYIIFISINNFDYVDIGMMSLPIVLSIGYFAAELTHADELGALRHDQNRIKHKTPPTEEQLEAIKQRRAYKLMRIKRIAKVVAVVSFALFALYILRKNLSFHEYIPNSFSTIAATGYFSWYLFDLAKNSFQIRSIELLQGAIKPLQKRSFLRKHARIFIYSLIATAVSAVAVLSFYNYFSQTQNPFFETLIGTPSLMNSLSSLGIAGYSWLQLSALWTTKKSRAQFRKIIPH